jgi:hypothetical protein
VQDRWCKLLEALPLNRNATAQRGLRACRHARRPRRSRRRPSCSRRRKATHEPEWEATFEALCGTDTL